MFDWLSNAQTTQTVIMWMAALGTLAIFSILYRENPVYRMAEHIFIGAAAGYGVYVTWSELLKSMWWDKLVAGNSYWVLALVVGAMFYFVFSQKYSWISRLVFGASMGLIVGTVFKGFAEFNLPQMRASFKPLAGVSAEQIANNALFIFILLTVMAYFFFSFEHKTAIRRVPSNIGRWALMFAFGAMFGQTVMARMALLIGRFYFIFHDWLRLAR